MNTNPTVTAIIVTHNRPHMISRAIQSVLDQTFQDFEILVVDNGQEKPAEEEVRAFADDRIVYIKNEKNTDCAGGKNIGIQTAKGTFIAFLDDDDIWFPEKLELQVGAFSKAPEDAAFCFTAAKDVFDDRETYTTVPEGVDDYYERALAKFSGFLSITLMIRKSVFESIELMDERFPSHTDCELVIRIAEEYKGIGINKPLVEVNHLSNHTQMGTNWQRKIQGREMILEKFADAYAKRPAVLAGHLAGLAKFYRSDRQYKKAGEVFARAFRTHFKLSYMFHYLSMFGGGAGYKLFRFIKKLTRRTIM